MARVVLGALLLTFLPSIHGFYLPGAAPHDYVQGEKVDLLVNALTPMRSGTNDKVVRIPLVNISHTSHLFTEVPS
jgi:transmembrane 9 superfamily protein 2/4